MYIYILYIYIYVIYIYVIKKILSYYELSFPPFLRFAKIVWRKHP